MRLPDFLIIGGMRCGTTSLSEILRSRSDVYLPAVKEIHFFDKRNPDIGASVDNYSEMFRDAPCHALCGEVTPDYLSTRDCDQFIKKVIPDVKLVALLRDPIERTWSHYQFSCFHKVEPEDFRDALALESERLKIRSDHTDIFFSYLQRSRYIEHLLRFESLFGRDRIHILLLEELLTDTEHTISQLVQFLGCDDTSPGDVHLPHANRMVDFHRAEQLSGGERRASRMNRLLRWFGPRSARHPAVLTDEDRRYLARYFRSHNADLEEWLGRPLSWDWSEVS